MKHRLQPREVGFLKRLHTPYAVDLPPFSILLHITPPGPAACCLLAGAGRGPRVSAEAAEAAE